MKKEMAPNRGSNPVAGEGKKPPTDRVVRARGMQRGPIKSNVGSGRVSDLGLELLMCHYFCLCVK